MQKTVSIIVALCMLTLVVNDAFATQIQIVTDNGNVFTVSATANSTANSNGSGNATSNGNGIVARIVTIHPQGTVISGIDNVVGQPYTLIPYNKITSGTFAAGFQNNDNVVKLIVPKMNGQYIYSGGVLIQNSTPQSNTLAPVSTSILAGSGSTTLSSSGITFTGTGSTIAVQANGAGSSVVEGTGITGGGLVVFGTPIDPSVSISAYDPTYGPGVFTSNAISSSTYGVTIHDPPVCIYCDARSTHWYYPTHVETHYLITIPVNKYVSSSSNAYAEYNWSYYSSTRFNCGYYVWCGGNQWGYSVTSSYGPAGATINGYQSGNKYYVQSLTYDTTNNLATYNPKFTLYDKSPFDPATSKTYTSDFTSQVNFAPTPYWFIVKPTSGGTIIKASAYDPTTQLFLQVTGLPANVPYQILENGIIGLQGITGSDGSLKLSAAQMVTGGQSLSGELDIYPNSPTYVGNIGTAVYDSVNNKVFNIASGTPQIYTPFAYVMIPMSSTENIQNVSVDGIAPTQLSYLSKIYTPGSSMMVPIIPGLKTITFSMNGTGAKIPLTSIPPSLGISVISPGTGTASQYKTDGTGASVRANTGGEGVVIAQLDGTIYALVSATISADVSFTANSAYNYVSNPPTMIYMVYDYMRGLYVQSTCPTFNGCQPGPISATGATSGPLSLYVDTYVNGQMVNSQIVYSNSNPMISQSSSISSYSFSQSSAVTMHYPTNTVTQLVQVSAHAGDLIEFYLRASVEADGNAISVPTSSYGVFTTSNQLSVGTATVNLSSGSILTGAS
ncbi:MAG: hypothetical protein KGH99_00940 [Thaumarchaeota archaeon]|nr:hypothetical protein [Candidatus Nitrosotalea sp.]MDE1872025.1 hypothetical protein [Nitrososphaerota archaeon]